MLTSVQFKYCKLFASEPCLSFRNLSRFICFSATFYHDCIYMYFVFLLYLSSKYWKDLVWSIYYSLHTYHVSTFCCMFYLSKDLVKGEWKPEVGLIELFHEMVYKTFCIRISIFIYLWLVVLAQLMYMNVCRHKLT